MLKPHLEVEPTPYLVSRFYRAPEIVLAAKCPRTKPSTSETLSNPKLPSYSGVTVNHHTNEPLEVNAFGAGTRTRWMFLPWDARFLSSLLGRFSSLESQKLKNPTQNLDPLYRREFADVLPRKGISSRKSYCYLSLPGVNLVEQVIKIAICFPFFMLSLKFFVPLRWLSFWGSLWVLQHFHLAPKDQQ